MAMSFVCRCTIGDVNRMTMLGIEEKSSFNKLVILLSANFFLLIKEKMNFFSKLDQQVVSVVDHIILLLSSYNL